MINSNKTILSISQINNQVKYSLENNYNDIWIKGEISSCKKYPSGHVYLTLKDDLSEISGVLFYKYASQITFEFQIGMKVIIQGNLSLYVPRGQYQLQIFNMYPSGQGELWLAFEKLKNKLKSEGLFDQKNKLIIPKYPQTIGIVTSTEGAVLQDMIHVLNRRAPNVKIIISPASVQGQNAPKEIAYAINQLNEYNKVDLIIVGRGGGSIEDLWAFNDEVVARAIFNSVIPIISAVGHETDVTISDYVADLRAPTPSAAAELSVPRIDDIIQYIDEVANRLRIETINIISKYNEKLEYIKNQYAFRKPIIDLKAKSEKISNYYYRLNLCKDKQFQVKNLNFEKTKKIFKSLDPKLQLKKGYALIINKNNKIVKSYTQVEKSENVKILLHKGMIKTKITHIKDQHE